MPRVRTSNRGSRQITPYWIRRRLEESPHAVGYATRWYDSGGHPSFAPGNIYRPIMYDKPDGNDDWQVYLNTLAGDAPVCLTDPEPDPDVLVTRHKGGGMWHPNGNYLILTVEMASHFGQLSQAVRDLCMPSLGAWNNVWMCLATGATWHQLTDYNTTQTPREGALYPRISHAGTRIAWSKMTGAPTEAAPLGTWQLWAADLRFSGLTPIAYNATDISPSSPRYTWIACNSFSADDSEIVYCSDYDGVTAFEASLGAFSFQSGLHRRIQHVSLEWFEHGMVAQSGVRLGQIATASTTPLVYTALSVTNQAEVMLADGHGREVGQVSRVNWTDQFEAAGGLEAGGSGAWSPDGRTLLWTRNRPEVSIHEKDLYMTSLREPIRKPRRCI